MKSTHTIGASEIAITTHAEARLFERCASSYLRDSADGESMRGFCTRRIRRAMSEVGCERNARGQCVCDDGENVYIVDPPWSGKDQHGRWVVVTVKPSPRRPLRGGIDENWIKERSA